MVNKTILEINFFAIQFVNMALLQNKEHIDKKKFVSGHIYYIQKNQQKENNIKSKKYKTIVIIRNEPEKKHT